MFKQILNKIKIPFFVLLFFGVMYAVWILLDLPKDEELIRIARVYFDRYGLATILIASIIEGTLLIGWYAPGGLVIFLGVILSGDVRGAVLSVGVTIIGLLIAMSINYALGRYGWYTLLLRLGGGGALEKAKDQFDTHGYKALALSYWSPNLASLTSTAAGIAHASFQKFLIFSMLLTSLWMIFWGTVTYIVGPHILNYLGLIFLVVMIVWGVAEVVKGRKRIIID
jgi:membrane protein DedA with SNARE-associated domain